MREWAIAGRGLRLAAGLAVLGLWLPGCSRDEPRPQLPSPTPVRESLGQREEPATRPAARSPRPPIPALEGAERPAESPLDALTEQDFGPAVSAPALELPRLDQDELDAGASSGDAPAQ